MFQKNAAEFATVIGATAGEFFDDRTVIVIRQCDRRRVRARLHRAGQGGLGNFNLLEGEGRPELCDAGIEVQFFLQDEPLQRRHSGSTQPASMVTLSRAPGHPSGSIP